MLKFEKKSVAERLNFPQCISSYILVHITNFLRGTSRLHEPTGFNFQQDGQCTYNRGAFVQNVLQCKSSEYYIFWVWVCSLSQPVCKAHDAILSSVAHSSITRTARFTIKYIKNVCFDFLYKFRLKPLIIIIIIIIIIQRDVVINVHWSSCSVRCYCHILMALEFSRQIVEKLKHQISWKSLQCQPRCYMWTETDRKARRS